MHCKEALKLVTPYLEGKLTGVQLQEFLEHLKDCDQCHAETETWYMITHTLNSFRDRTSVDYDLRGILDAHIDDQLKQLANKKRYKKYMLILLILLSLAAAVLLSQYFGLLSLDFLEGCL